MWLQLSPNFLKYFLRINDKQSFVDLLAILKSALSPKGKLLAAAVNSGAWQISQSYIIPDVCRHLDLVNLMTYDFIYPITATGRIYLLSVKIDLNLKSDCLRN